AVRMTNTASGISDTLTVAKVSDGATGSTGSTGGTGAAGADAYTVLLTNQAQVFAGTTTTAVAKTGAATSNVIVYKGATQIPAVLSQPSPVTGMTLTVTPGTSPLLTIDVTTALTGPTGTIPLTITADGKTFTQVFSWSIGFTGSTGS